MRQFLLVQLMGTSREKMHATTSYQMPIRDYVPLNAITGQKAYSTIDLMEGKKKERFYKPGYTVC
jgi:hypothetical protein